MGKKESGGRNNPMAMQTSLFGEIPASPIGLYMSEEQRLVISKIPCLSTGRPKNERLEEIQRQLQNFSFSGQELELFDKEVSLYVKHYGYAGNYPIGSKKWR